MNNQNHTSQLKFFGCHMQPQLMGEHQ